MTHINPEIVADKLIELGVSQDEFITALATPSKNKELAKLANEVLEKIRGQRNPNSYGAKFITELREHLKHHKDSCGSPALEEPVKKYVQNPLALRQGATLKDELITQLCRHSYNVLEALKSDNYSRSVKEFSDFVKVFKKFAYDVKHVEFTPEVQEKFCTAVGELCLIQQEFLTHDRFDIQMMEDLDSTLISLHHQMTDRK